MKTNCREKAYKQRSTIEMCTIWPRKINILEMLFDQFSHLQDVFRYNVCCTVAAASLSR